MSSVIMSASSGPVGSRWGKYGVIQEQDFFLKRPELQQWLLEIKGISMEGIPARQEKTYFRDYIEEYNTAALPHKKFYDLAKWDKAKQAKKSSSKNVQALHPFDDERARLAEIQEHRAIRRRHEESSVLGEIRDDSAKVAAMRHQQTLQTQMRTLFQMGRIEEAQKIRDRLNPDTEVADELASVRLE